MKIVVINGTAVKGVTAYMKQLFLEKLSGTHEIIEFYPKDFPPFCTGCKNCFSRGKAYCPHAHEVSVIWQAITKADLLVFAYPVYALRVPASIKSLLDHFCVHWMVHRPEPRLFEKTAVILTNSIGASNQAAQNDVRTSLSWMGVSRIYRCGAGMMGDIMVDHLSIKHQKMLTKKTAYFSTKGRFYIND